LWCRLGQRPQKVGRRRERHVGRRFVADNPKLVRELYTRDRLGQKPTLPATRLADDNGAGDLAAPERAGDASERRQLVDPTDEQAHSPKRTAKLPRPKIARGT
jgi:hypothetical protein